MGAAPFRRHETIIPREQAAPRGAAASAHLPAHAAMSDGGVGSGGSGVGAAAAAPRSFAHALAAERFTALQAHLDDEVPGLLVVTLNRPQVWVGSPGRPLPSSVHHPPTRAPRPPNHPQAFNALSMELVGELHRLMSLLEPPGSMLTEPAAGTPRVVLLRGAGRAFCGGVDIKVRVGWWARSGRHPLNTRSCPPTPPRAQQAADQGAGGAAWDYHDFRSQRTLSSLIERMRSLPQPVIAAVQVRGGACSAHLATCPSQHPPTPAPHPQGAAAGAGFALAMAADCRVAARSARFSAAFVRLGLSGTDMGTSFHAWRLAGLGGASELLLTGREMGAGRAHQVRRGGSVGCCTPRARAAVDSNCAPPPSPAPPHPAHPRDDSWAW